MTPPNTAELIERLRAQLFALPVQGPVPEDLGREVMLLFNHARGDFMSGDGGMIIHHPGHALDLLLAIEALSDRVTTGEGREEATVLRSLRDHFARLSKMPSSSHPHYPNGMRPFGNGDVRANIKAIDYALSTLSRPEGGVGDPVEETGWAAARVMEVNSEGVGRWRPCSGCQESVDGCVSTKDYPYSAMFGCQPGSGCRECGGLGVIWDTTDYEDMARFMLADEEAPHIAEREVGDHAIFDILEALKPHFPNIAAGFARRTGGVDLPFVLAALSEPAKAVVTPAISGEQCNCGLTKHGPGDHHELCLFKPHKAEREAAIRTAVQAEIDKLRGADSPWAVGIRERLRTALKATIPQDDITKKGDERG